MQMTGGVALRFAQLESRVTSREFENHVLHSFLLDRKSDGSVLRDGTGLRKLLCEAGLLLKYAPDFWSLDGMYRPCEYTLNNTGEIFLVEREARIAFSTRGNHGQIVGIWFVQQYREGTWSRVWVGLPQWTQLTTSLSSA